MARTTYTIHQTIRGRLQLVLDDTSGNPDGHGGVIDLGSVDFPIEFDVTVGGDMGGSVRDEEKEEGNG